MTYVVCNKPRKRTHGAGELKAHTRAVGIGFGLLLAFLAVMAAGKSVLHDSLDPDLF
jgi:hypothetical protein